MLTKFRKKPVVIEAVQWNGKNADEIQLFSRGIVRYSASEGAIIIKTLEGFMRASVGDWIIRGVNGEFYACKPDVFEKTYEPV